MAHGRLVADHRFEREQIGVGVDARHEHLHDVDLDVRIGAANGRHGRIDERLDVGRVALRVAEALEQAADVSARGHVELEPLGVHVGEVLERGGGEDAALGERVLTTRATAEGAQQRDQYAGYLELVGVAGGQGVVDAQFGRELVDELRDERVVAARVRVALTRLQVVSVVEEQRRGGVEHSVHQSVQQTTRVRIMKNLINNNNNNKSSQFLLEFVGPVE